jgi:hypothetical protein
MMTRGTIDIQRTCSFENRMINIKAFSAIALSAFIAGALLVIPRATLQVEAEELIPRTGASSRASIC